MQWMQYRKQLLQLRMKLTQVFKAIGCCDLCSENLSETPFNNKLNKSSLLCQHCLADLPRFNLEHINGNLLSWPAIYHALPDIHFDYLLSLSPYTSPFEHWLSQFKYQGRFELAYLFSSLLSEQWKVAVAMNNRLKPDLILSVPLHPSKWQVRGYNQAHLLAKNFAKKVQLPYSPLTLIRVKKSTSQVGKTGSQRRKNLHNAFALTATLPAQVKHVLLVDDVVTTGSTASEISKLLKNNGVETVTLVTVCLSLPK